MSCAQTANLQRYCWSCTAPLPPPPPSSAAAAFSGGDVWHRTASGLHPSYSRLSPSTAASGMQAHCSCGWPCQSGCSTRRGNRPSSHQTEPPAGCGTETEQCELG